MAREIRVVDRGGDRIESEDRLLFSFRLFSSLADRWLGGYPIEELQGDTALLLSLQQT